MNSKIPVAAGTAGIIAVAALFFIAGCAQQGSGPGAPQQQEAAQGGAQAAAGIGQPAASSVAGQGAENAVIEDAIATLQAKYGKSTTPEVRVIGNVENLRQKQAAIYGNAKNGMLVAAWSDLLVVYDPASSSVVQELPISTMGG